MSNQPRVFRKTTLEMAVRVLQDAGLPICGAEITADGLVRVLTTPAIAPVERANPFLQRPDDLKKTQVNQVK